MVEEENAGLRMPAFRTRPESVDTADSLVTVTLYVLVVVPSWAVTTIVIVLGPTTSGIAWLAVPDGTVIPFTLIVAVASVTVARIVSELVVLDTFAV